VRKTLQVLAGCTGLTLLALGGSKAALSAGGLAALAPIKRLQNLTLNSGPLPSSAFLALAQQLPELHILNIPEPSDLPVLIDSWAAFFAIVVSWRLLLQTPCQFQCTALSAASLR